MHIQELTHDGHERVVSFSDDDGFQCFIALHNMTLGRAIGGCRVKSYASSDDALADVLLLSRGMTYKCALSGLNFGGGKCVVMAPKATDEIMHKVGEAVNYFNGDYITGEDVGTTLEHIGKIGEVSQYVLRHDGSAMTARGVAICMATAIDWLGEWRISKGDQMSTRDLAAIPIWVEGVGKVGIDLVRRLHEVGADVYVSDLRPEAVQQAVAQYGAHAIDESGKKFMAIFAPCATGQVVTAANVDRIAFTVICGSANNQLADDRYATNLMDRHVLYVPDFLCNAGGAIAAACEIDQPYDEKMAEAMTDNLGVRLRTILEMAASEKITPLAAAYRLADMRLSPPAI